MIDHIWTVICSQAIIDQRSRNVSIHNVVEQLNINSMPEPDFVLNIRLEAVSFWVRTAPDISVRGHSRLSFLTPSSDSVGSFESEIDLSEFERGRTIIHFDQLPIQSPGRHYFQIELRSEGETEWNRVAAIPLMIVFKPPENEEEVSQPEDSEG